MSDDAVGDNSPGLLHLATRADINLRGLKVAAVVGTVLAGINHGDRLLAGEVDGEVLAKIVLTYFVPYLVSMWSSVQALRKSPLPRPPED